MRSHFFIGWLIAFELIITFFFAGGCSLSKNQGFAIYLTKGVIPPTRCQL